MHRRFTYRVVSLKGSMDEISAELTKHGHEGFRLLHTVSGATATAPCTVLYPLAILEREERPR